MDPLHDRDVPILVTGAGGFIGGQLVQRLRRDGYRRIRAVDCKPPDEWFQRDPAADNRVLDLRDAAACTTACAGTQVVFQLAADMGGMGFIESHRAECMLSVLINTHMLLAARAAAVQRYFYASSACVYAADRQNRAAVTALRESDAYPAMPEDGYGWEKLFSERMCRHFREDFGVPTRIGRFHNVYGPHGSWRGGREKAPAGLCRKVLAAVHDGSGEIEIWGDGSQTRSFLYIDDCLEGILRLSRSDVVEPLNIGSDELVTIDGLVDVVEAVAGTKLRRRYRLDAPRGVMGRNSDNTRIRERLGWAPGIPLRVGMVPTFRWIEQEFVAARQRVVLQPPWRRAPTPTPVAPPGTPTR